jgi:hypothetical protein
LENAPKLSSAKQTPMPVSKIPKTNCNLKNAAREDVPFFMYVVIPLLRGVLNLDVTEATELLVQMSRLCLLRLCNVARG